MNKTLEKIKRKMLIEILDQFQYYQNTFKRIYSPSDLDKPISQIVIDMPANDLDDALTKVQFDINCLARTEK